MKNLLLILTVLFVCLQSGRGQQTASDTSRDAFPQLELPEITIVGKKAIALPFARKGEKYDINIYQALPPDSSLIGKRPEISFLPGAIPDYKERRKPWHFSAMGTAGNFTAGSLNAYASYNDLRWRFDGQAGLSTTQGHISNADAFSGMLDLDARTMLKTDNTLLRTLDIGLGVKIYHDSYGMFGIPLAEIDRTRNNWIFSSDINSLDRSSNALDIHISTSSWSVTDRNAGVDSKVSSVSPEIQGIFTTTFNAIKISTELLYTGSSVNYTQSSENPSLLQLNAYAQWKYGDKWTFRAGGLVGGGSDNMGGNVTLVSPVAEAELNISAQSSVRFFWKPELHLTTYDENIRRNPYLVREFTIRPERSPVVLGSSFSIQSGSTVLEISGTFSQSSDKSVTIADSGMIRLEYVKANQVTVMLNGSMKPTQNIRISMTTIFQPTHEEGITTQLPMVPLFKLQGRGELSLDIPVSVSASVDYWSRQNVDRAGTQDIAAPILVGSGISTTYLKQAVISFEINNLFNTGYEWWSGYPAPGREFKLRARINIQ